MPTDQNKAMAPLSVLLVDDENDFRATLAKRLTRRGIKVLEAARGDAALQMLDQQAVDVIIMDVKMPGLSGLETLQEVKKRQLNSEVIMLTGHGTTQGGVEGIKAGAFDYLMKPIEIEQLESKIRQAGDTIRRRAAEEQEADFREQMKQQMIVTERLAALGTLATGVAHEINNPLAIIKEAAGWMQQLFGRPELRDIPRRTDFEKALDKIHNGVERARRITHQLLQVVKTQETALTEVDLTELIAETLELIKKTASNKNVAVHFTRPQEPALIWSDSYRLRQVLLNLLTNAVYATAAEGHVSVGVQVDATEAQITVQDTGCGIPKEIQAKIFEPFFSTKPPGEGTGMGLYVSRGIVEKLEGRLEVQSRMGQGTRFRITLPLKPISR